MRLVLSLLAVAIALPASLASAEGAYHAPFGSIGGSVFRPVSIDLVASGFAGVPLSLVQTGNFALVMRRSNGGIAVKVRNTGDTLDTWSIADTGASSQADMLTVTSGGFNITGTGNLAGLLVPDGDNTRDMGTNLVQWSTVFSHNVRSAIGGAHLDLSADDSSVRITSGISGAGSIGTIIDATGADFLLDVQAASGSRVKVDPAGKTVISNGGTAITVEPAAMKVSLGTTATWDDTGGGGITTNASANPIDARPSGATSTNPWRHSYVSGDHLFESYVAAGTNIAAHYDAPNAPDVLRLFESGGSGRETLTNAGIYSVTNGTNTITIDPTAPSITIGTKTLTRNSQLMGFGITGLIGAVATDRFFGLGSSAVLLNANLRWAVPARTFRNLRVRANTGPDSTLSETAAVVVQKNGTDTAITCSLSGTGVQTCADASNTDTFSAGDVITVRITQSAATAITADVTATIEMDE